tara:strand:+ start:99 stop:416 length:318 start_codon:yes stop_codon:yes gene_type:complete
MVELDLGIAHMCARFEGGKIQCSGTNYRGQVGDGTRTLRPNFVPVVGIDASSKVTCGRRFSCSLSTEGKIQCWGDNAFKQLGYAPNSRKAKPSRIVFANLAGSTD